MQTRRKVMLPCQQTPLTVIAFFKRAQATVAAGLEVMPRCVPLWIAATQLERQGRNIAETRWTYIAGLRFVPFAAALWLQAIEFEAQVATRQVSAVSLNEIAMLHGRWYP
eukprot:m.372513 g.372513  ORF g.372513 m.372513 type:complete len:110 (+) comp19995_c5_seq2:91-420(+)